jgi:Asp/Glu/hydantoin racemase
LTHNGPTLYIPAHRKRVLAIISSSRPGIEQRESTIDQERDRALRGEPPEAVEGAVKEAVAAIEEDGAEVITFGCSDVF